MKFELKMRLAVRQPAHNRRTQNTSVISNTNSGHFQRLAVAVVTFFRHNFAENGLHDLKMVSKDTSRDCQFYTICDKNQLLNTNIVTASYGSFSPHIMRCRTPGSGRTPGVRCQVVIGVITLPKIIAWT
jgi:hypothetical protein